MFTNTFCTPCVTKLYQGAPLTCPTCRGETIVPDGNVGKLPMNFELLKIMEQVTKLKVSKDVPQRPNCQTCSRKGIHNQSEGFCVQCKRNHCNVCIQKHKEVPAFKMHQLVDTVVQKATQDENLCVKHGEIVQSVCMECLHALCIDCIDEKEHAEHLDKVLPIEDGIAQLRTEHTQNKSKVAVHLELLGRMKQNIKSHIDICDTSVRKITKIRESLEAKVTEVVKMLKEASINGVLMKKAQNEVTEMIDQARKHQTILKEADNYSNIRFLAHKRENPFLSKCILSKETVSRRVQIYQIPVFTANQIFENTEFIRPVGELTERSPHDTECHLTHDTSGEVKELEKKIKPHYASSNRIRSCQCEGCNNLARLVCNTCDIFVCNKCRAKHFH